MKIITLKAVFNLQSLQDLTRMAMKNTLAVKEIEGLSDVITSTMTEALVVEDMKDALVVDVMTETMMESIKEKEVDLKDLEEHLVSISFSF